MKKILAVVLISAAAPAFAGSVDLTGFYAGVTVGQGNANFTAPAAPAGLVVDNAKRTVAGAFGGYRYNPNLAVEVDVTGVGNTYTTVGATKYLSQQSVVALVALGSLPVSDSFSVFAKLGGALASSENNAVIGEQKVNRFAPTFGVGAEYKFTPNVGARLSYDVYGVTTAFPTTTVRQQSTAKVANFGLSYAF
jgi:OOP family OmpA-OmpF porin